MNTREVAAELSLALGVDVTPKAVRRFVREHDGWHAVGVGATYDFTSHDVDRMARMIRTTGTRPQLLEWLSDGGDPGVSVAAMKYAKTHPNVRASILERRRARANRLDQRIMEVSR